MQEMKQERPDPLPETSAQKKPAKKRRNASVRLNEVMAANGQVKDRWDIMFDRLVEFKRRHGHCLVPNRYKEDRSLGSWVSTQRRQFKILTSGSSESTPMTPERASRLMSIGFAWATKDPRHVPWETRFQELLEFKNRYGHCLVPVGYKGNPKLSNWVSTQRQEKKALNEGRPSRMTQERIKALEEIGFVWEAQRGGPRKRKDPPPSASPSIDETMAALDPASAFPGYLLQSSLPNVPRGLSSAALGVASLPSSSLMAPTAGSAFAQLPIHLRRQQDEQLALQLSKAREEAQLLDAIERERALRQQQEQLILARRIQSLSQSSPLSYSGLLLNNPGATLSSGIPQASQALPPFTAMNYPATNRHFPVDSITPGQLARAPQLDPVRAEPTSMFQRRNRPSDEIEEEKYRHERDPSDYYMGTKKRRSS